MCNRSLFLICMKVRSGFPLLRTSHNCTLFIKSPLACACYSKRHLLKCNKQQSICPLCRYWGSAAAAGACCAPQLWGWHQSLCSKAQWQRRRPAIPGNIPPSVVSRSLRRLSGNGAPETLEYGWWVVYRCARCTSACLRALVIWLWDLKWSD